MNKITAHILPEQVKDEFSFFKKTNAIASNNWDYSCDVKAGFNIAHNRDNIYLSFSVTEPYVKAQFTKINEPVWEDSCLEFFITFDNENYYNFEFNCIGNVLVGYGPDKNNRTHIDESVLRNIITTPSLGRNKIDIVDRKTEWTLDVIIPKSVFIHSQIESLVGLKTKSNFYKCGDKLAVPHFLSWNPIETEEPNFHKPEFFGELVFEASEISIEKIALNDTH